MQKSAMVDMFNDEPENNYDVIPAVKDLLYTKSMIDELEEKLKALKSDFKSDEERVFAMMEANNMQSVNVDGFNVHQKIDTYARLNKDFENEAKDWIRAEGYENLIKETVNSRSLTSAIKERIEDDGIDSIPTDLILISTVNRIGIRKAPKKRK